MIEADEKELQALAGLLNAGVQAVGLRACKDALVWIDKIEAELTRLQLEQKGNGNPPNDPV